MALELALLISDFLTKNGGKFEGVSFALKRFMQEHKKYREETDGDIRDWNKQMALYHAVLGADIENERKGRVKPDTLSEEERNAIIRLAVEAGMKEIEISYWYRIGVLMTEGLTPEEAREKIYQNLLQKGDLKGAKTIRVFQDKYHPLKTNDQMPPSSPPQPPSPT